MNEGYTVRYSARAKRVRISVHAGGAVNVTAPRSCSMNYIETFMRSSVGWIQQARERMQDRIAMPVSGKRAYRAHKEQARAVITALVYLWSQRLSVRYQRIAIKDTRRTWGSCSTHGNLNFSYKLLFLPEHLREYVVVHELCHLREPNHSPQFWALVNDALPEYDARRKELRKYVLR